MRQLISFLVIVFLSSQVLVSGALAQVIYVNLAATGTNDGSSWSNAFTKLGDALAAAPNGGELWVAQGVYHPGVPNPGPQSVFAIRTSISMYGGFVGNEISPDQRATDNETYLSGDINNDDIPEDFQNNRGDNTRHVLYIDSLLNTVVIDGFTITGGHTTDNPNDNVYQRSGGGMFARSSVHISSCKFAGNFGRSGGGIYLANTATNSIITDCVFEKNKTSDQGAGLFALRVSGLEIRRCTFSDNQTVRGAVFPFACTNVSVDSCDFLDNTNNAFNGGALFSWQNIDLEIRNSNFRNNSANFGGAIVINGSEIPGGMLSGILIENCTFESNMANEWGGAIYCLRSPDIRILSCSFLYNSASVAGAISLDQSIPNQTDTSTTWVDSCVFISNHASGLGGGAMHMRFTEAKIENCLFDSNTTTALNNGGGAHIFKNCPGKSVVLRENIFRNGYSIKFGGAATAYGHEAQFLFQSCTFIDNRAERFGGAVHSAFGAQTVYRDCIFSGNNSLTHHGGALSTEHDSTTIRVLRSAFSFNSADESGGAIFSGIGSGSIIVDQCVFSGNESRSSIGGAIHISESGDDDISYLKINNSLFGFNTSVDQGGAVSAEDADTEIINSVFFENISTEDGRGAAISLNATDRDTVECSILNTTFASNHGYLADGLSQSTGSSEALLTTHIQNCLFHNQGATNYYVGSGSPVMISKGGNMSDDLSMSDILKHPQDLNLAAPVFSDPWNFDYSLQSNSPGIDAGVAEGAPEFDILGNPRVNAPDIGAYEYQGAVMAGSPGNSHEQLIVSPNPCSGDWVLLTINNAWTGDVRISLLDCQGRIEYVVEVKKMSEAISILIDAQVLSPGSYHVIASDRREEIFATMIKL